MGPCDASVEILKVDDVRTQKRKYVVERAKKILREMMETGMEDSQKLTEIIKESVRTYEVSNYHGLACGPGITEDEEIIVVEGRADVLNLLKNGIRNVIAMEGSNIPEPLIKLTREKTTTAFIDGDRGGELDLKKLLIVADIDFIARADEGMEVEELTKKQVFKALRERVPAGQIDVAKRPASPVEIVEEKTQEDVKIENTGVLSSYLEDLIGTRAAYLVDRDMKIITKCPISEIGSAIDNYSNVGCIVFDGKINQDIVDLAESRNVGVIVGMSYKDRISAKKVRTLVMEDLRQQ